MSSLEATVPLCRHQLAIYDCTACQTKLAQQDTAAYLTTSTSPNIYYLPMAQERNIMIPEVDHQRDSVYCGGRLESSNRMHERSQLETNRLKKHKTSSSRTHGLKKHKAECIGDTPPQDSASRVPHSHKHSSSRLSQLVQQSSTLTPNRKPSSNQKNAMTVSLPLTYHPHTNTRQPTTYHPPPVTDCYQLDRFLDEIPDFRFASLSEDQDELNGRCKSEERTKRHRHALAVRAGVLSEVIEGY